jgi:AraC-like DNA-binding protein
MPRRRKPAAPSSRIVPHLITYVRAQGGDADGLIRRFGLPRDVEHLSEAPVAPAEFERIVGAAATALGDPLLAVHLPGVIKWSSYSVPELAARASPTLAEAFARVTRYASLFYADLLIGCVERDGELLITHRLRAGGGGRYSSEYGLASSLQNARRVTGVGLRPKRVWFAHPRPRETAAQNGAVLDGLRHFFGTQQIDFGRLDSGMAFDATVQALPTVSGDERLLATAEQLAEKVLEEHPPEGDLTAQATLELRRALNGGPVDAAAIARRLGLSTRTLQRRLDEGGTSFKDLLERVRQDLARGYLREGAIALTEIAYRLGFSDVATFSRAFKRWTGQPPGAFRREK